MAYERNIRKNGSFLILGDTSYRIEKLEGCGGSSVVYQATYPDKLNQELSHRVLIKELYPYHPKGKIYRDESGNICCLEDAKDVMEFAKMRFRQGNQVNLELLEMLPSQTSGNLNSYEAYGTYYSVLTVHGGRNLRDILEERKPGGSLREAVRITEKILDALEHFHQNHLLHLDLSPDNILILPEQAMLIDYNSAWSMVDGYGKDFPFSKKEGYSAPEIWLEDVSQIGYFTDLYSVCAIFFQFLMGRTLTDDEIIGKGLKKNLTPALEIFHNQPKSAIHKAIQIVWRGLQTLQRYRYQDIDSIRSDFDELLDRIDGRGVTRSALWESSRTHCLKIFFSDNEYFEQKIRLLENNIFTLEELYENLKDGTNILLKGPGGMGKTRLLRELWRSKTRYYRPELPVTYYIPLKDYQEMPGTTDYIRRYLTRNLSFSEKEKHTQDAIYELERIFKDKIGMEAGIIFLLDGLNEAGSDYGGLLKEIEILSGYEGVRILVTDRSDDVKRYGLYSFQTAELMPLDFRFVEEQFQAFGFSKPDNREFCELLRTPMMLEIYLQVAGWQKEEGVSTSAAIQIQEVNDLVQMYLNRLLEHQLRIYAGNQAAQLCFRYILGHLLPEIAGQMRRQGATLLKLDELVGVVNQSYSNLQNQDFGKVFSDYLGKSRHMLENIRNESEWFDYAVTELLQDRMGLLVKTESGYYGFIHDNFIDCLAETSYENTVRLLEYKKSEEKKRRKSIVQKCFMASILPILIAAVIAGGVIVHHKRQSKAIGAMVNQLLVSMGTLSRQLDTQKFLLETVKESNLLGRGASSDMEMEMVRNTIQDTISLEAKNSVPDHYHEVIQELKKAGANVPIELIEDLCAKPVKMKKIMQDVSNWLEYCLFDIDGYTPEKKAECVELYDSYLDAYIEECVYELYLVRSDLDEKHCFELDKAAQYFSQFRTRYIDRLSSVEKLSQKDIRVALSMISDSDVKDNKNNLKRRIQATAGDDLASCLE